MRTTFYMLFILSVGVTLATVILGTRALSKHAWSGSAQIAVPADVDYGAPLPDVFPSVFPDVLPPPPTDTSPPVSAPVESDPRPARPKRDVVMWQKGNAERFDRVLRRFYPGERDPPDARLLLAISVTSDGKVAEAASRNSTFKNPAFEAALIDEVKRTKYPEDERYRTTGFSVEFQSVKPLPQRPLAEIQAGRAALLARIETRRQAIFAASPPPPGARLKVEYRVPPDGIVDRVRLASSSYHSPAFEKAVLAEIRKLRFRPDTGYAASQVSYEYGALDSVEGASPASGEQGGAVPRPVPE